MENKSTPVYPEYQRILRRLFSFATWPKALNQKPIELSEIGYFYTGTGDSIICFYCGCCISDWEPTDSPYERHAKWYPNCEYLHSIKSRDLINNKISRTSNLSLSDTSNKICVICFENNYNTVFTPCGHVASCFECATKLHKCPICKKKVKKTLRIYFS